VHFKNNKFYCLDLYFCAFLFWLQVHFQYEKPAAFSNFVCFYFGCRCTSKTTNFTALISISARFYFGCRCTSNTRSRLPSLIFFALILAAYALQKQQVYRLDLYFCAFLFWLQVRFQYDKSAAFITQLIDPLMTAFKQVCPLFRFGFYVICCEC